MDVGGLGATLAKSTSKSMALCRGSIQWSTNNYQKPKPGHNWKWQMRTIWNYWNTASQMAIKISDLEFQHHYQFGLWSCTKNLAMMQMDNVFLTRGEFPHDLLRVIIFSRSLAFTEYFKMSWVHWNSSYYSNLVWYVTADSGTEPKKHLRTQIRNSDF